MQELTNAAVIGNFIITLLIIVGGYIALRSGKHRTAGEIQSQVIDALKAELETLQRRMDALEKENTRLTQIMSLIKQALRTRGLTISIEGELVTISDNGTSQSAHIQEEH